MYTLTIKIEKTDVDAPGPDSGSELLNLEMISYDTRDFAAVLTAVAANVKEWEY